MSNKDFERNSEFVQALTEWSLEQCKKYENVENEDIEFSKRLRRKINRLGREKVGLKTALHPEVDNVFERIRSRIVCWYNKNVKREK